MARPLFLGGPPCVGKSTVGRIVANVTGAVFFDLDEQLGSRGGAPLRELTEAPGPRLPPLAESLIREHLAREEPVVVALGWEALLERPTRLMVVEGGVLVNLDASAAELLHRAEASGHWVARTEDAAHELGRALEWRQAADAEAHSRISTDGLPAEEVAARAIEAWKRKPIVVAAGERTYCVELAIEQAAVRATEAARRAPVALVVTDANVAPLHSAPLVDRLAGTGSRVELIVLEPGEQNKTPNAVSRIWERALGAGADRSSVLVALGGGVVTDVAGFAAATYMRGIRWVVLPTTLLGMVDASVGGKTAVDLGPAKNAVGAFWQPSVVICDAVFLRTEPERGYVSALAEVVKTALIGDAELLDLIEQRSGQVLKRDLALLAQVVRRCVAVKAGVVSRDERETGLRAVLNLGHTVGHALEAAEGYGSLTHGEAISLGLVAALRIGQNLGRTPAELVGRVTGILQALRLPTSMRKEQLAAAVELLRHDKKRTGASLKFVVAEEVGRVRTLRVGLEELAALVGGLA